MRTLAPKPRTKTVRLRKNGKHKIKGATVKASIDYSMRRILRPQARYNWMMPTLAAITPQYIETVLNGALAGNFVQQYELFDLMLRTWPELSACCGELREGVLRKKLIFEPYCEEDEEPSPTALEKQRLISTALRQMQPDTEHDGNDLNGTLTNILDAWLRGVSVSEIVWQNYDDPKLKTFIAPFSTYWVNPVYYAFASDSTIGLRPKKEQRDQSFYPFSTTSAQPVYVDPFPPNKFLIAIHKAKSGSPLSGALLVPLAWWWCAANFSSDWLLNLAQLFGLPFRWANYDPNAPQATIDAICQMLQNMGSAGWAAFPTGTTLELHQPGQNGSDHSPQGELLDRADRYARLLILGQTMTGTHGTTGKGGGQAFGEVEKDVKSDRIDAAGKFSAEVINRQLIPMILMLNYGDTEEMPTIKFLEDEVAGLNEAQRDKTLADAGMEIGVDYLRKKYDIPAPSEGEETIGGEKPDPFGSIGNQFGQDPNSDEPPQSEDEPAKAGDQTGHPFRGNQYVRLGTFVNTPYGKGIVVANGVGYSFVSINGGIRRVKVSDMTKIPHDKSNFPSITHSAEAERRAALNSKLEELNKITDDAVFARELAALAGIKLEDQPKRKTFTITRSDGTIISGKVETE
jgi:phage gp29-like protein